MTCQELTTKVQKATLSYLGFQIEIQLPDPSDDNTIHVAIHRAEGTYDPNLFNSYLTNYQFSANNPDPNVWLLEAMEIAITTLKQWDVAYAVDCDTSLPSENNREEDLVGIPF
jgi:hypothetical protein